MNNEINQLQILKLHLYIVCLLPYIFKIMYLTYVIYILGFFCIKDDVVSSILILSSVQTLATSLMFENWH